MLRVTCQPAYGDMDTEFLLCPTSQNPETGNELVPIMLRVQLPAMVLFDGRAVTAPATLKIVP